MGRDATSNMLERHEGSAPPVTRDSRLREVAVMFFILLSTWTVRLMARDETRGWVSDEVSQQNILLAWQNGLNDGATVGPDNFYLRFPLYVLLNNLPLSPLNALRVTSWVLLAVIGLAAAVALSHTPDPAAPAARRRLALGAGCFVLIGLPQSYFDFLAFPNSRNLQVAALFLLGAIALDHFRSPRPYDRWGGVRVACATLLMALLFADDPLTSVQVAVPFALLVGLEWLRDSPLRKSTHIAAGMVITALVLGEMLRRLLGLLLPLDYVRIPTQVVSFTEFGSNLHGFVTYAGDIFGLDPWGQPLVSGGVLLSAVRVLPLLIVAQAFSRSRTAGPLLFLRLLGVSAGFNLLLVASLPQGAGDPGLSRFYLHLVVTLALGIALVVSQMPSQRGPLAVVGCYALAAALVMGSATRIILDEASGIANERDAAVLEAAENTGAGKGYADYSLSSITTFLSEGRIPVIGVLCGHTAVPPPRLAYFDVLQERALLVTPSTESFYAYRDDSLCTPKTLQEQLGEPTEDAAAPGAPGIRLARYPYDLAERIDS